jgi:hypothetical protein
MSKDPFPSLFERVREFIRASQTTPFAAEPPPADTAFNELARQIFAAQFAAVTPFQQLCRSRGVTPDTITDWRAMPAVPTAAFKEFAFSSLAPAARITVFHSSGTTGRTPSRHFHDAASLALYEDSARPWFWKHLLPDSHSGSATPNLRVISLIPPAAKAPHSSLAHMIQAVAGAVVPGESQFVGATNAAGDWRVDFAAAEAALEHCERHGERACVLGTSFTFIHLLDHLAARGRAFRLPAGSRVMETGGYKGRSRELSRPDLHAFITRQLGVPPASIVGEYGMSELSSQAYDHIAGSAEAAPWVFQFPPWARARVISPETDGEVGDGEIGLLRVVDLANVRSVLAIQTEDLAIRRGNGFELVGRAPQAEPRGCSLMSA